ncbi:hypothetical protein ASPWEDRAFT_372411 [Aspergillus wentii DTO 134E9]|uniref:Zn(2)-C6 fungal-type domain-containing protein n=1 Tax=Aspergillus wentii DTO 134E9 TaxID=1073089 RepID=A0A1L9RX30_ASPWE|nr:uncharacterized protein ASPWEDRAFT_372411 [Aspergillus wentii DTO 134E9]KAI9928919.1 hypothetical protein MW887_001312 [Aspergillus wentii]OJJ39398.1 hypothetical protein ASPWEDRAFT_372411 [Aspergillus wentii DTO 134E9]
MTKGCYTCRRRRIICDNGLPTCRKCRDAGKECLGYQKPLVWVKGGVASRGKMMGRSFDEAKTDSDHNGPSSSGPLPLPMVDACGPTRPHKPGNAGGCETSMVQTVSRAQSNNVNDFVFTEDYIPSPWGLVDPLLKDLSQFSRMYMFHFNQYLINDLVLYPNMGNPYRELLALVGDSPVLAHALSATGALHYSLMANEDFSPMPWSNDATPNGKQLSPQEVENLAINSMRRRPISKVYEHFLGFKQRALHQVSQDISDPVMRNDNRTLAAIMLLSLMDAIESGDGAWKYHLEGAKKLIKSRQNDSDRSQARGIIDWLDTFAVDGCLIIQLMGSTLARPGVLSKPVYTSSMGPAVLERLEKTSWVGCPAYLLDVIFFVHSGWCWGDSDADSDSQPRMVFSSSFLPKNSHPLHSPDALLQHIQAFDPVSWAESMQTYLFLPDTSVRVALATVYKASVYLYASRALSRPRTSFVLTSARFGLPADHASVADILIRQIALIPVADPHFKCLIWPTFIAGAECRNASQRAFILDRLSTLYYAVASVNVRNAAWVLSLMWRKQDLRRETRRKDSMGQDAQSPSPSPTSSNDERINDYDDDFDWIQELDDSRVDWLFI